MTYAFTLTYENDEGVSKITTYHEVAEELTEEELNDLTDDILRSNPDAVSCGLKYITERSEGESK